VAGLKRSPYQPRALAMTRATISSAQRPGRGSLIIVYSIWIGIIAAIASIPELAFLGIVAFVLLLLIWMPYWAYRNWSSITEDLGATYATIVVTVIATFLLGAYVKSGAEPLVHLLVSSGIMDKNDQVVHGNWIEYVAGQICLFTLFLLWQFLRKKLQHRPSIHSSGHGLPQEKGPYAKRQGEQDGAPNL
jgi:hypothetical protein